MTALTEQLEHIREMERLLGDDCHDCSCDSPRRKTFIDALILDALGPDADAFGDRWQDRQRYMQSLNV